MMRISTLKRTTSVVLMLTLGSLMYSCELVNCEECSDDIREEIKQIGSGNVSTYKSFMKKHPDPEYKCCDRNSIINSQTYSTKRYVLSSDNLEIIKNFFTYNLSQDTKNDFLRGYWGGNMNNITKFLIDQDAKLESYNYCDSSFLSGLKKLHKLGYDMNYIDPKSGRNLFLDYSAIGYEKEVFKDSECAIECLKYLKSVGVDTQIKDVDGKSALEIASDPVIINYLKSI